MIFRQFLHPEPVAASRAAFVAAMLRDLPAPPPDAAEIRVVNLAA
jgi:hypothetical protein